MATVNSKGYVERKTKSGKGPNANPTKREWWLVKHHGSVGNNTGKIEINKICFPAKYVGKRIRLKVEIIS